MPKKKNTISKPKKKYPDYHKPKMVTLADGSKVMERYHNDYGSKPVYQKEQKDVEDGPAPKDAASKSKYPPPKNDKIFRTKWMQFIGSVTSRENFKDAHLVGLEVLCDLYVEYEALMHTLRTEGRTYEAVSRFGTTKKMHPAVAQVDKVRSNIRTYTQRLDLFPKKDNSTGAEGEEEEWS